ncbi:unnamed protein product [Phyllotreta striolata]|uniref:UDP-glucuronosyltransferase n=1 Tax=Phyllotreta striolata TaxID=444603 RepID=A0A9N9TTY8_PHYSR|nr:unnamed protein product [Phyllotreta striolata]
MSPILIVIALSVYATHGAKILGIITIASVSHHLPFQPLWQELSNRGHDVTVITTDPLRNLSNYNLKEIDISYTYKIYEKHEISNVISDESNTYAKIASVIQKVFFEANDYLMNLPEVQDLLHNEKNHFDVVLVEAHMPSMLAFGWKFKCPVIGIASLDPAMQYHDSLGNLVHPVINPDPNLDIADSENLSFMDRVRSFIYTVAYKYVINYMTFPTHHEHMKKYFGDDLPPFDVLQDNISLMLTGTNPLFHNMRPINLNTIPIGGGMHLKPPRDLPQDIQSFLDDSLNEVIYFSLGSNVKCNVLTENFKRVVMEAFTELPYKVILKTDCNMTSVPSNVFIKKWMPQQDVLRHPNIKLFISQGGLQSLQESISNSIPLIGIPFFGDQITNVNRMVKRGYGIKLDKRTINKDILIKAIKEVMNNPKYRQTAKLMGDIFKDEEIPSLRRAVFWTEYIIRHKGAKHLRSSVIGMPAWKYYMFDVLGFFLACGICIVMLLYLLTKLFLSVLRHAFDLALITVKQSKLKCD